MQIGCLIYIVFWLIGTAVGGGIGGVIGIVLASLLNNVVIKNQDIPGNVLYAVTALSAKVMRADNKIQRSELYLFKNFMLSYFGQTAASKSIDILKDIKDKSISIEKQCATLNNILNYTEKLEIIRFLFQLAYIDGDLNQRELLILNNISAYLQIRQQDYNYIRNTYFYYSQRQSRSHSEEYSRSYQTSTRAKDYAILGVSETDSNDEIKKAYRQLAVENHPDKIEHLGETARKKAEENFVKINEAYQRIKKERNIV